MNVRPLQSWFGRAHDSLEFQAEMLCTSHLPRLLACRHLWLPPSTRANRERYARAARTQLADPKAHSAGGTVR